LVSEIEKKREVIGSMYPEKLTFDGEGGGLNKTSKALRAFLLLFAVRFRARSTRPAPKAKNLREAEVLPILLVDLPVQFSNLFIHDLRRLASIIP
jgi:hypothetical protein